MKTKLKKGDRVIVIAGNDRGKEGKLLSIVGRRGVVEGVNRRKRHQKGEDRKKGGKIISFEALVDLSNLSFSVEGKPVKLKARLNEKGKKEIFYKKKPDGEEVLREI